MTSHFRTPLRLTDDVPIEAGTALAPIEWVSEDLSIVDEASVILAIKTIWTTHAVALARVGALNCGTWSRLTGYPKILATAFQAWITAGLPSLPLQVLSPTLYTDLTARAAVFWIDIDRIAALGNGTILCIARNRPPRTGTYLALVCEVSELYSIWDNPSIILALGTIRAALAWYMDRMSAGRTTYQPLGALVNTSNLSHLTSTALTRVPLRDKLFSILISCPLINTLPTFCTALPW